MDIKLLNASTDKLAYSNKIFAIGCCSAIAN